MKRTGQTKRTGQPTASLLRRVVASSEHVPEEDLAPTRTAGEIFRRFWPDARPYRWWAVLTFVFIALGPVIAVVEIYLYKVLVDDVLVPRDFGPFIWLVVAYVGLNLLSGLVAFLDDYLSVWIGENFLLGLRTRLFGHLLAQSPDDLDRRRLGDVLSRLSGDVRSIETFVFLAVQSGIADALKVIFFTGALFFIDPLLAILALGAAPLFWYVAQRFAGVIKDVSREKQHRSGALNAVAEQALSNLALVQASNRTEDELRRYEREGRAIVGASLASTKLESLLQPVVHLIELIGAMLVVGAGVWALTEGRITLGEMLVFLTYLTQLYRPVRSLTGLVNDLSSASAGAERVIELLDEEATVSERAEAIDAEDVVGRVEFDAVSFSYRTTTGPTLDRVSFAAGPGDLVALVGPSGAGKSTLLKAMVRFVDPVSGAVRLDGHDVRQLSLASLRRSVGILLQETLIFDGSVRDNIAYARPGAAIEDIEAAARATDAHDFIARLPDGYDTIVGSKGRSLSGGQRQRVALARLLLHDAPVMLLDEPSAALDAVSARDALDPFLQMTRDRTTIVVSHDLVTARRADLIVVLDQGRVVEHGRHDDLVAAGGMYAHLHTLAGLPDREGAAVERVPAS